MRKFVFTGVAMALALGLTGCEGDYTTQPPPSSSNGSAPAPSGTSTPDGASTTGTPSTPGETSAPQGSDDQGAPEQSSEPAPPSGQQITSRWGRLRYLAPGKFTVGGVVFFTATDTVLYVAGGTCPSGAATEPNMGRCSMNGFDQWVQNAPHNAKVHFSGQAATRITETQ